MYMLASSNANQVEISRRREHEYAHIPFFTVYTYT